MGRCHFVGVYPSMPSHNRMGKLAGWRPRGHHQRVRESHMMNFELYKRGDRDIPYRSSVGRKKENEVHSIRHGLRVSKSLAGVELVSEEPCVVYPRCPFVVVLSRLWICDDCSLLNPSSCASVKVDGCTSW